MTNEQYLKMVTDSQEALKEADELHRSNITIWGEQNGPYKFKQKIKAPFNLFINVPHTYEKDVTIFKVEPVHVNNYFWVWQIKATEGKDIHTWYEPIEI